MSKIEFDDDEFLDDFQTPEDFVEMLLVEMTCGCAGHSTRMKTLVYAVMTSLYNTRFTSAVWDELSEDEFLPDLFYFIVASLEDNFELVEHGSSARRGWLDWSQTESFRVFWKALHEKANEDPSVFFLLKDDGVLYRYELEYDEEANQVNPAVLKLLEEQRSRVNPARFFG